VYAYEKGGARKFVQRVASAFPIWLGVALLGAVATVPADAKKKSKPIETPAEVVWDLANGEPLTLVVSVGDQEIDLYRGLTLITSSKVSTGTREYPTKPGVFSILEKRRYHHSNMYSAAPMPWMQRLTWSGTALHAGVVPGYPASHGCIRLPFSFAPKLFQITTGGENVIVAHTRPVPQILDHPTLFQPSTLSDEQDSGGSSANDTHSLFNEPEPFSAEIAEDHAVTSAIDSSGGILSDATSGHGVDDASSLAPLRILVTRRIERDRIISVQYLLSSMGYLPPQKFSGRLGTATASAIKAFQKANGIKETGTFTDDLVKRIYESAAQEQPPEGHIFVRQGYRALFDAPMTFRNLEQPLGTHLFSALFASGDSTARWMAISLEGSATAALDRIAIPADIRERISEKLTPGSSLIVADESKDSAILPDGGDFIVFAKYAPSVAEMPSAEVKHAKVKKAPGNRKWGRTNRGYAYRLRDFDRPRRFYRWRWNW
jgi:lipoprotein-anchoring transpeptidase ErfK/SrfK